MEFCIYSEDENVIKMLSSKNFESALQIASNDYEIKANSEVNFLKLLDIAMVMYFQIKQSEDSFPLSFPSEVFTSNQNNNNL